MRSHGGTGICEVRGSPRQPESSTGSRGHFFVVLGVSQGFSGFTCGFQGLVVVENKTRTGSSKLLPTNIQQIWPEYPPTFTGLCTVVVRICTQYYPEYAPLLAELLTDLHTTLSEKWSDLRRYLCGLCPYCSAILSRLSASIDPSLTEICAVFPASLYRIFRNIQRLIQHVFPEYPLFLDVF